MTCNAAQLRALTRILEPYRGRTLDRDLIDVALRLARVTALETAA